MPTRKWGIEKLVNAGLAGSQLSSSVTGLTGGGFVVVWQDGDGITPVPVIRGQRYDALGNKLGGEINISAFIGGADVLDDPKVTALADGGFYVAWTDIFSPDSNILGAVFNANGGFVRAQFSELFPAAATSSDVAQFGAGSVSVWQEPDATGSGIFFRIFDGAGIGGAVLPANTITGGQQDDPSVATITDGSKMAIVWENHFNGNIKGRIFNPAGTALSPEFEIASSGAVGEPVVTWLNNTLFAVAWQNLDLLNGGSDKQIFVKIFDVQYQPPAELTGNILVNSTLSGTQVNPRITALPNGGFVVLWEDNSGVGGDFGSAVRLQAFDGAGGKIGGEILVNTTTTGNQLAPSIAALADGRVVVSWTDFSSGNADIRIQIVDPRDGIVSGTSNGDTLYGHDGAVDEISGFAGNDTMYGFAGADTLFGDDGGDFLYGGRGDDTSYGGSDSDRIYGDLGDDEQYGEVGSDIIYSGSGSDLMDGGTGVGSDTAYYSSEKTGAIINLLDQTLNAGSAIGDTLLNFESLFGSAIAADTITGGNGNETILGNGGADVLNGSGGIDFLRGGTGADRLNGGIGADKFQYTALNEVGDVIITYEAIDDFQFTRAAFGNLAGANVAAVNFLSVASGHAATTVNHRFVFDQALDQLWYDADGSLGGVAVMVADLSNNINVTNLDLLLF